MNDNRSIIAGFETERVVTGPFTGAFQTLGAMISKQPVILIFDNQSTVSVEVSVDGINTWKTFSSGSALILDLRANIGRADNFVVRLNTQFYVKGTAGTGSFRLSIIYPE
jgi:hypothetical protein